jgi:single-stranded-DNA-specific exonuclease
VVELTGRPSVLIAIDGEMAKGSGRSIPAFDLHGALTMCSEHFERFGGHRAAAGITIESAKIPAFAAAFNRIARQQLTYDDLAPEIRLDFELPLSAVNDELFDLLRECEPHGVGNPGPVFFTRNVRSVGSVRKLNESGIRMRIKDGNTEIEAIDWDFGRRLSGIDLSMPMDIAYRLDREEYQGMARLQARIADIRQ